MKKYKDKSCPKCNTVFECNVGAIQLCQCATVQLNEAELEYIKQRFNDCLCANCMKVLQTEYRNQLL